VRPGCRPRGDEMKKLREETALWANLVKEIRKQ
jgi:hypothetical protein